MTLAEIVAILRSRDLVVRAPEQDVEITSLAVDSRTVSPGALFLAEQGSTADGHDFIASAVARGAAAVVAERYLELPVPLVIVRAGREAVRAVAESWYGFPAEALELVGITGTNGKTTTTSVTRHLLNGDGHSGLIGTLGAFDGADERIPSSAGALTTPGALDLQATFRGMVDRGVRRVTMECSSHALDQGRLDGLSYEAGIFTNLTHEHLDYHETMAAYLAAKLRLADLVSADGILAINADDPAWEPLRRDSRCLSWGIGTGADVCAEQVVFSVRGARFTLTGHFGRHELSVPYLGEFNVSNALAAATVALALGRPMEEVAHRLETAPQVPGRMERLADHPMVVLRDYAHTPDAFQRVLTTLRPLTKGRLFLVFGCGGDRDRAKRPVMGQLAAAGADMVMLTEDNPRTEDPDRIIDDIVAGMPSGSYQRCVDRAEGIARVLEQATENDVVLLAGKGHETYQIVGKEYRPFDERAIVRQVLGQ